MPTTRILPGATVFTAGPNVQQAGDTELGGRLATYDAVGQSAGTTLTFVAGSTLHQLGTGGELDASVPPPEGGNGLSPDRILLDGTVRLDVPGGTFTMAGGGFHNAGLIDVAAGDRLDLRAQDFASAGTIRVGGHGSVLDAGPGPQGIGAFSNTGTVLVTDGATLALGDAGDDTASPGWRNTGHIVVDRGTLSLGGVFQTAALAGIRGTADSTLVLAGLVQNGGVVLNATERGFSTLVLTGELAGGAVSDARGAMRFATGGPPGAPQYPVLADLRWSGVLNLAASPTTLAVAGDLSMQAATGAGPGLLRLGSGSTLGFGGNGTLRGADLRLAGTLAETEGTGRLTLAADTTVRVTGDTAAITGAVLNLGRITDAPGTPTLRVGMLTNAGTLSLGDATVDAGSPIDNAARGTIGGAGTLQGELHNAGALAASGGTLAVTGPVDGTGLETVGPRAVLALWSGASAGQTVAFGPDARLDLSHAGSFAGLLAGLAAGDTIDLTGDTVAAVSLTPAGLALTLADGNHDLLRTATPVHATLTLSVDGHVLSFG